jgi:hypothetical protein
MNQGAQGYSLTKKTEGRKSRDTVSLRIVNAIFFDFTLLLHKEATNFFFFMEQSP